MTVKKIVVEIDARIECLQIKRSDLESERRAIRCEDPWYGMTDQEIDELPRQSRFWKKTNEYRDKISKIDVELYVLRDMRYAYEQTPYKI